MHETDPSFTGQPPVLVLCRDLLFASKITSAAQAAGVPVRVLRDPSKLDAEPHGRRLLVDLTQPDTLAAAARWKARTAGHVTAFAGHTDVQTLDEARSAGLDQVLARGAFAANLPRILRDG